MGAVQVHPAVASTIMSDPTPESSNLEMEFLRLRRRVHQLEGWCVDYTGDLLAEYRYQIAKMRFEYPHLLITSGARGRYYDTIENPVAIGVPC